MAKQNFNVSQDAKVNGESGDHRVHQVHEDLTVSQVTVGRADLSESKVREENLENPVHPVLMETKDHAVHPGRWDLLDNLVKMDSLENKDNQDLEEIVVNKESVDHLDKLVISFYS